jgi:type IV pilus assembly protein PilC
MRYKFTAKDASSKLVYGDIVAPSVEKVGDMLKDRGLFVMDVTEDSGGFGGFSLKLSHVSESDVVLFTRQFATMVSAGLSVSRCLEVLLDQATNPAFRLVITDIQMQISAGTPLSGAFGKYPAIFSNAYVSLCKAGESSGKLDDIMLKLADTMEKDKDVKGKFKTAMIYPTIIMFAMLGVFVLMMVVVVPQLADLYNSMNVDLPLITRLMIGVSGFMVTYKFLLLAATVAGFFGLKSFLGTTKGREFSSEVMFAVPVIGAVNKLKEYSLFSRTLSMLLASGVSMVESLNIASEVCTNLALKRAVKNSLAQVERGVPLSEAMSQTKIFPAMIYKMVQVGEETGNLDAVLSRVSLYYANETDTAVTRLSAALEPFILVFLGVGVGTLILSIITPIYKITTSI